MMLLPKQEAKMLPSSIASTGGRQAPDIVGFCRVVLPFMQSRMQAHDSLGL